VLLVNERPGVGSMAVPSKLTSYFIAGKPILAATDPFSGSAEELQASGAGVVVPPGDPQALVDGVRNIAASGSAMKELGDRGRKYAHSVLSVESAVTAYERWSIGLCERSHRP